MKLIISTVKMYTLNTNRPILIF